MRARIGLGIGVAAVLTTVVSAVPATATASPEECPNNKVCLWEEPDFGGEMKTFTPPGLEDPEECVTTGFASGARSAVNKTEVSAVMGLSDECDGPELYPGESTPDHDPIRSILIHRA